MRNLAILMLQAGAISLSVVTIYTYFVTATSYLHTFLPPWDDPAIAQFPSFQKWYHLFIVFLGYAAVSRRSGVYKQISTENGTKPSPNAVKTTNGENK